MQKNVASQKWYVFAFDETDNTAVTGDAANITADVHIDGAAANAVDDTNPTELSAGYYVFDITAAESNGDQIVIIPVSATANVQVIGVPGSYDTTAPNFNLAAIDGSGRVDIGEWLGEAVAAVSVNGVPEVDLTHIGGQAISGNNATLALKQLDIQNSAGSAIVAKSTGSNGHGMDVAGNGTGEGLLSTGGATGNGIEAVGGATSGAGIKASASANNDAGMELVKHGTGIDLDSEVSLTHIMDVILTEGGGGRLAAAFIKLLDVATPALVASDVMRGTDSAALASVATEARLAELDAANLPTDIAAIPTTAMRGTDNAALASVATEARLAELDAANLPTDIAAIPTTAMRGTDNAALASVATEARLAELDAGNLPTDVAAIPTTTPDAAGTAAGLHSTTDGKIDAVQSDVTSIKSFSDFQTKWRNNRMAFTSTSMILYDDDATTPLLTWTLSQGSLSVDGPYNRSAGA